MNSVGEEDRNFLLRGFSHPWVGFYAELGVLISESGKYRVCHKSIRQTCCYLVCGFKNAAVITGIRARGH